jgi:hypothetical protein
VRGRPGIVSESDAADPVSAVDDERADPEIERRHEDGDRRIVPHGSGHGRNPSPGELGPVDPAAARPAKATSPGCARRIVTSGGAPRFVP